jgi:hypothetical protein
MAILRTVLSRKGFVQPQHGITQYESDLDGNFAMLDANVAFMSDLAAAIDPLVGDFGINGVVTGFTLAPSGSLTPGLTAGTLYANGIRAVLSAPSLGAAPANATSYLFYSEEDYPPQFYYRSTLAPLNAGDAFIGIVVTNGTQVISVTQATALWGWVSVTPTGPGNFTVPHLLGRTPLVASIVYTSAGQVWWQSPTDRDNLNLYLVASDAGVTAKVQIC